MLPNSTRRMTNLCNPGDVVVIDFPGVSGIKRRPAVVVSSPVYHALRPDIVVALITSQRTDLGPTDYTLQIGHWRACESPQPFVVFSLHCLPLALCLSAIFRIAIGRASAPASGWRLPLWRPRSRRAHRRHSPPCAEAKPSNVGMNCGKLELPDRVPKLEPGNQ